MAVSHSLSFALPPLSATTRFRSSFHPDGSSRATWHILTPFPLLSSLSSKNLNDIQIRRIRGRHGMPIRSRAMADRFEVSASVSATCPLLLIRKCSFSLSCRRNLVGKKQLRYTWQCRSSQGDKSPQGEGLPSPVQPPPSHPKDDVSNGAKGEATQRPPNKATGSPKGKNNDNHSWWRWIRLPQLDWSRIGAMALFFLQSFLVAVILHVTTRLLPKSWLGGASWRPPQSPPVTTVTVPFSEFLHQVGKRHVAKVQVDGERLTFTVKPEAVGKVVLKGGENAEPGTATWSTIRPGDLTTPYDLLISKNVEFGAPDKRSLHLLNSVSVGLLYAGLVVALLGRLPLKFPQRSTGRTQGKRGGSSGNRDRGPVVLFADVAGVDEAKEELEEIVEYLREPERFLQLGARPPRGVLLVGPPGTGKTLLAKAVAGEADVPFISCAASEFVELYVGLGAARVRDLFARAKKDAPSIVFIDEIDAVAKGRDGRLRSMGNDEREQTLNQLLTELDGFDSSATVIVLAATNRADVLDPALRRPGRFDRIVSVEAPDRAGREAILRVHLRNKQMPLADDSHVPTLAAATPGFTGADLANLVNEAALLAARARKLTVGREEFELAVERSRGGIEKKRSALGRVEKGVVARHEVGHALVGAAVAQVLPGFPLAEKLSIVPRSGGALGFTYMPPPSGEERMLLFIDEVRGRLVTLLGGRAAEEVAFRGRVSTGALDDIRRATDVAYKAVAEYGLSSAVGPLSLATLSGGGFDDSGGGAAFPWGKDQGHVTALVQKEVCDLLQKALVVARCVLTANLDILEGLGSLLEVEEKVQGAELSQWLSQVQIPPELTAYVHNNDDILELPITSSISQLNDVIVPDAGLNIEPFSS